MGLDIGIVLVSNKILLDQEEARWMYREVTNRQGDSGWRVYSSTEDETYLSYPKNFGLLTADQLIEIDDSLKVNLLAPIGSSFEKNNDNMWEVVDIGRG